MYNDVIHLAGDKVIDSSNKVLYYAETNVDMSPKSQTDSSPKDQLYHSFVLSRRATDNSTVGHGLYLRIDPDGTRIVNVTESKPWRIGFGADSNGYWPITLGGTGQSTHSITSTLSDFFTANTTNATINSGSFAKWGKIGYFVLSWTPKADISVNASGNITNIEIGTFKSGYRPCARAHPTSDGDNAGAAFYNIQTNGILSVGAYDSTGSARTISHTGNYSSNIVQGMFILA